MKTMKGKIMFLIKIIILLVILVCVAFFFLGLKSQKGSPPGLVGGVLAPCGSKPNCVCSEPDGQPERAIAALSGSMSDIKAAIVETGGVITGETDHYLSATYMSGVFKFVDDVEVRDTGDGVIHIRSSSRVGYSDRGVNRKRVEKLRYLLSQS